MIETRTACPNCGDTTADPCQRCATYGAHGGKCLHDRIAATKKRDTTQPQPIGGRLVVRVAPETHTIGYGFRLRMFRLTHPFGRQRITGTGNFLSPENARGYAVDHGWTVLGPQPQEKQR